MIVTHRTTLYLRARRFLAKQPAVDLPADPQQ
jgi:hypothetical protein